MSYIQVSINDKDFEKKLCDAFMEDGIAVINDVISKSDCDQYVSEIVNYFEKLGTGVKRNKAKETWTDYNLPLQTRPGLFQALVSNIQTVWDIRSNGSIRRIFEILYGHIRQEKVTDFIVSNDGINVRPGGIGPFADETNEDDDWPHVDQTIRENPLLCIQGQAVLTNTTAAFRASLKSYKQFEKIMDFKNIGYGDTRNWLPINKMDRGEVKKYIEEVNGSWQTPIYVPAGSFIVWSSTTVHSAKLENKELRKNVTVKRKNDPWYGWRCVVYVCYRPLSDLTSDNLEIRKSIVENNRTSNHWGSVTFKKSPVKNNANLHPKILELMEEPKKVYEISPDMKPKLNEVQLSLAGLTN